MKRSIIAAAICLPAFMYSCKDSSSTTTTNNASTNHEHMSSVYRGIESGDMSAMDSFVTDDIVDHTGMPTEIRGRDNLKKNLADMHNHFSNLKMEIVADATSADDQYHFALVRMTGTATDDKFGRPANTPVDEMSVDVVKLKDGKATEHWAYNDPNEMMKMMQGHKMPDAAMMDTSKMAGKPMDSTMKH